MNFYPDASGASTGINDIEDKIKQLNPIESMIGKIGVKKSVLHRIKKNILFKFLYL